MPGMMDRSAWEEAGANGFVRVHARGIRWRRWRFRPRGGAFDPGPGRGGFSGFGGSLHRASVAPSHPAPRHRRAEEALAAALATGELIGAIAMTEPGTALPAGACTTAAREGRQLPHQRQQDLHHQRPTANLVIVVCKTNKGPGRAGSALMVVETDGRPGLPPGRNLDKLGMDAQDTSELFFDDVVVPAWPTCWVGRGMGFIQLMQELPQERLIVAPGRYCRHGAGHAGNPGYVPGARRSASPSLRSRTRASSWPNARRC